MQVYPSKQHSFIGVKVKEKPPEDEPENNELADDIEVEEEDDYLIYLSSILKRVHKMFYKVYDKVFHFNLFSSFG